MPPAVAFFPDEHATDFWRDYLGRQLEGLGEPSLYEGRQDPARVAVRFLWLRTYHAPICVRLELTSEPELIAKTAKTKSGFERPRDVSMRSLRLASEQAEAVAIRIHAALLVAYPRQLACDGAAWLLEHVRSGSYRVAELNSPGKDEVRGPFRAAAWQLIELAGTDFIEGPVY
jgi:hypothetical protein